MKQVLGLFLSVAFLVIMIVAFIWELGGETLNQETGKYEEHIDDNMSELIQSHMSNNSP